MGTLGGGAPDVALPCVEEGVALEPVVGGGAAGGDEALPPARKRLRGEQPAPEGFLQRGMPAVQIASPAEVESPEARRKAYLKFYGKLVRWLCRIRPNVGTVTVCDGKAFFALLPDDRVAVAERWAREDDLADDATKT